jgi:hypothetical protein
MGATRFRAESDPHHHQGESGVRAPGLGESICANLELWSDDVNTATEREDGARDRRLPHASIQKSADSRIGSSKEPDRAPKGKW